VKLYSRPGNDFTRRFPLIVDALSRLRSGSCIIDGEAVACDDNGVASFDLVRHHRANENIFLYAFDLIELNGDDLRRDPLEVRKATLASIVAKARPGIRFNEHMNAGLELRGRGLAYPALFGRFSFETNVFGYTPFGSDSSFSPADERGRCVPAMFGVGVAPDEEPRSGSSSSAHESTSGRSTNHGHGDLIRVFRGIGRIVS